jgi:hypothetical protein
VSVTEKQHVEIQRKLRLRLSLLKFAIPGPAYVPFVGDAEIAAAIYRKPPVTAVYAADIDPKRIATCTKRCPEFTAKVADCELWPFEGLDAEFSVADFDAYVYPYGACRAFWANARKARRLVMFFTDGQRARITRGNVGKDARYTDPNGVTHELFEMSERRALYNFYRKRVIEPWLKEFTKGWTINKVESYLRLHMFYFGCVLTRN